MNSTFTNNAMYDLLVKHLKLKVKVAMSQTALELTVQLKTGDSKQFTKSCDTNNTSVTLNSLRQNCFTLQKEVNDFLTTLVEEERSVSNVNNESKTNDSMEDDDDDDDDEEDDEEDGVNSSGPKCKRLKQ